MIKMKDSYKVLGCFVIGVMIGVGMGMASYFLTSRQETSGVEVQSESSSVTFVAVGDILVEEGIYDYLGSDYDFKDYFDDVLPYLKGDIMFMNQETIIGGDEAGVKKDNYVFNTPTKVADQLCDLGFNMVSLANNHCLDMGEEGLSHSINYWSNKENVIASGTYATQEDRATPRVIEKNGVRFGFVAYTTFTNKKWLSEENQYQVGYNQDLKTRQLDQEHREQIKQEIDTLRPLCDVLVVSCHWGKEGSFEVSNAQKEMAIYLNELGVDIVVGTHPHVMQPCEWIEDEKTGHRTFVAYSLGNFISSDADVDTNEECGDAYSISGILALTVTKKEQGFAIENVVYTPVVNHFTTDHTYYHLYPIDLYNESLSQQHARQTYSPNGFHYASIQELILKVMDNGAININMKGSVNDG